MNFDYSGALKLILPPFDSICLALVGCGGTGSWLAPSVVRVARLLKERDKGVEVLFIDPDTVEQKNVYRQNFCDAEVGGSKAYSLAYRYGLAWGVEITAVMEKFSAQSKSFGSDLTVVIGCVDRGSARQDLARWCDWPKRWWLDCGNHHAAGQVAIGCGRQGKSNPFVLPGFSSYAPSPALQHPELLEETLENEPEAGLSCAEMAMRDSQGLAINQRIAAEAADYLVRLLLTKDLVKMTTYLDLAAGSARSVYVTQENIQPYLEVA